MSKVYVCSRFTHYDDFLFEHFMNYYLKLGVYKFLINFNYKLENDNEDFKKFVEYVKNSEYIDKIIYNIGPNLENLNETGNIIMIKQLIIDNTNLDKDYIIPADSDEFQEFPDTLENILTLMEIEELSYLNGYTKERVSESGEVKMVEKDKDIFLQFPKYNNKLFSQSKIGIIRAKYFHYTGVGHHYINIESIKNLEDKIKLCKNKRLSITNHFKWNLQGKNRLQYWYNLWDNKNYKGWKDLEKCKKMLDVFNSNLLNY
jgi:hypothetical protein